MRAHRQTLNCGARQLWFPQENLKLTYNGRLSVWPFDIHEEVDLIAADGEVTPADLLWLLSGERS